MSKRIFSDRKQKFKKTKEIIYISYEGDTEDNYFFKFNNKSQNFRVLRAYGNQTDPVNLVKNLYNTIINKYGNNFFEENRAYCIFDLDTYKNKEKQIKEAIKMCKDYNIIPITSAPCIELWYLLHYKKYNSYINSYDAVEKLKLYIKNYEKGIDIYDELLPNIDKAIKNAKDLEKINIRNDKMIGALDTNPNTEIYKLVEYLIKHD